MFRPTYEECAKHFSYNPKTGEICWKEPTCPRIKAGQVAGCVTKEGYLRVSFKGGCIAQHRLAWLLHYGEWPDGDIDHINRKRSDNRIENLRIATPKENARNREYRKPGQMRHGGSGVTYHKRSGKFQVQVHCPKRGGPVYGGLFECEIDALSKAESLRREFDL